MVVPGRGRAHFAAAVAYLGLALWTMGPVLPRMADSYPMPADAKVGPISDSDQSHMIWVASRTARVLVTAPWRLWDFEFCHPFPKAVALGHHNYASGLLAAVPYALTGEPVLAHNVVSILMLWLSGLGMYALAFYWTRSVPAAFVAGLLFALQHVRLATLRWPALVGNEWTPLALLFTHRLFDRERWRDAAALAFFTSMQVLESFYQLPPLAVYGLLYGGVLAVRRRARLAALAPKLLAVLAVIAVVTAVVAIPYLEVQATWGALTGHGNVYPPLNFLWFGDRLYPGTVMLALGLVGLIDRMRRPRRADPRLPFLAAATILLLIIVGGLIVPGVAFIRSPGQWIIHLIPGLDVGRGFTSGLQGVWIATSLLAAYGLAALTERRTVPVRLALSATVATLTLVEAFHPAVSSASFGRSGRQSAASLDVPRELLSMLDENLPEGALIDLPASNPALAIPQRAHRMVLASFHRHPLAICAASFPSPLGPEVEALGLRLPDPRAIEALHAIGFRSALLHEEEIGFPQKLADMRKRLAPPHTGTTALVEIGDAQGHRLYRLQTAAAVRHDLELLAAGASTVKLPTQTVSPGANEIVVMFRNAGPQTFAHPHPIAPTTFVGRWYDANDAVVAEAPVRLTLPLALAAGDVAIRRFGLAVPATPGAYRLTIAPASAPDIVVAFVPVTVAPAARE